jgi:iron-sulfur cluster assembly accessory protein
MDAAGPALAGSPVTAAAGNGHEKPGLERRVAAMDLNLTPNAIKMVHEFLHEHGNTPEAGLRVAVLPGGCSGFQYDVDIDAGPEGDDEILERQGIRIFVDPFSAQYLEGIEIDYVTSLMGSGFSFRNPQATGGCGCGSSFTV